MAARATALIAAFMPGASPPDVNTPIFIQHHHLKISFTIIPQIMPLTRKIIMVKNDF
jgi:hypothetical protein